MLRPEDEAPPIRRDPKVISTLGGARERHPGRPGGQRDPQPVEPARILREGAPLVRRHAARDGRRSPATTVRYARPLPRVRDSDPGAAAVRGPRPGSVAPDVLPGASTCSRPGSASTPTAICPTSLRSPRRQRARAARAPALVRARRAGARARRLDHRARRASARSSFVPANVALPYTVRFENPAGAPTTANEMRIVTPARQRPDRALASAWATCKIGDITVNMPSDRASFQGEFDLRNARASSCASAPASTPRPRTASWVLQAIDPETGEVLQDAHARPARARQRAGRRAASSATPCPARSVRHAAREIRASARVLLDTQAPVDTQRDHAAGSTPRRRSRRSARPQVAAGGARLRTCAGRRPTSPAARASRTRRSTCRDDGGDWTHLAAPDDRDVRGLRGRRRPPATSSSRCRPTTPATASVRPPPVAVPDDGSRPTSASSPRSAARRSDVGVPPAPSADAVDQPAVHAGRAGRAVAGADVAVANSPPCSRRSAARPSAPASRRASPASARSRCSNGPTAPSS